MDSLQTQLISHPSVITKYSEVIVKKTKILYSMILISTLVGIILYTLALLNDKEVMAELISICTLITTLGLFSSWVDSLHNGENSDTSTILLYFVMVLAFSIGIWLLVKIYIGEVNIYDNFFTNLLDYYNRPR